MGILDVMRYFAGATNNNNNNTKEEEEDHHQQQQGYSCPWLMLTETTTEESESEASSDSTLVIKRRFFDISTGKTMELDLPEAQGRRCFGSPLGWLITIGTDLNIHLLNPLTRRRIPLPPKPTFQDHDCWPNDPQRNRLCFLTKLALSSPPTTPNCLVLVIYGLYSKLAFSTPGDSAWTPVITNDSSTHHHFRDIIFFDNLFYVVDQFGHLYRCDLTPTHPQVISFITSPPPAPFRQRSSDFYAYSFYLVDISGDLCMLVRYTLKDLTVRQSRRFTADFQAFRLDFPTKTWVELYNLGNHALFLGTNTSFALHHPHLKPNSIYFTDDRVSGFANGGCDIGLFDFGQKKVCDDSFYPGEDTWSMFCPPLFFTPSLS